MKLAELAQQINSAIQQHPEWEGLDVFLQSNWKTPIQKPFTLIYIGSADHPYHNSLFLQGIPE
jgi:hypothetical protein